MPDFWVDSDVLIRSKNEWASFDMNPSFWEQLDARYVASIVSSPMKVYSELTNEYHDDQLSAWAKDRKATHFVEPDEQVSAAFQRIADFVMNSYPRASAEEFLRGADPWLIAHEVANGGVIVGNETVANPTTRKVKIPNICQAFDVPLPVTLFEMMRALGFRFE